MTELGRVLAANGLQPAGPAVANFLFVRVGDADAAHDALLRRGVIVRPMGSFGAADALRITAGTPDEVAFLGEALAAVRAPVAAGTVR
jgi:histidinol-phosphate aminotransferase